MSKRSRPSKRLYIYGLTTTLFIVASVTVLSKPLFAPDQNAAKVVATDQAELPESLDQLATMDKIQHLAQADGNGEAVEQIELQRRGDKMYYVVELEDGMVLAYDAKSAKSVKPSDKKISDESDRQALPKNFQVRLGLGEIRMIGLREVPNGVLRDIRLEVQGGMVVYNIGFKDGKRLAVDAETGAVIEPGKKSPANAETPKPARGNGNDTPVSSDDSAVNAAKDEKKPEPKTVAPATPANSSDRSDNENRPSFLERLRERMRDMWGRLGSDER